MNNTKQGFSPFDKFLGEESVRLGIPRELVSLITHSQEIVATFDMYKDIVDPYKRHAYRLLLNCADVIAELSSDQVIEEVEKANRKICTMQLQNKKLTPRQRARLEKSAFFE